MRVAVLGGGISGLSAAYRLNRQGIKVTLFESTARVGGWIETDRSFEHVLESGPRSIRPVGLAGATTLEMVHRLGLENSMIVRKRDHITAKNRFILFNNKLNKLPSSPLDLLFNTPPVLKGVLWSAMKEVFVGKSVEKDETIHAFIARRFGKAVAENLVSAIVHGIYAGDIKQLSVKSTFRSMWNAEKLFGSVVVGLIRTPKQKVDLAAVTSDTACKLFIESTMTNALYSFQDGLATFTDTLAQYLSQQPNITIHKNTRLDDINVEKMTVRYRTRASKASSQFVRDQPNGDYLHLKDTTNTDSFDYIISALPSIVYHRITGLGDELQSALGKIPYQDVIVTNFVFEKKELPVQGFGFLIPSSQKMDVLGVILDSETLGEQEIGNWMRVTVMQRRAYHPVSSVNQTIQSTTIDKARGVELTDSEYVDKCWPVLAHLTLDEHSVLKIKVNKQLNCIAQYICGHDENVESIRRLFGSVEVCGSSYDGVSINDCVESGKIAAERVLRMIEGVKV